MSSVQHLASTAWTAAGGVRVGVNSLGNFLCPPGEPVVDLTEYKCSDVVAELVRRRHGRHIHVMGSTLGEIRNV